MDYEEIKEKIMEDLTFREIESAVYESVSDYGTTRIPYEIEMINQFFRSPLEALESQREVYRHEEYFYFDAYGRIHFLSQDDYEDYIRDLFYCNNLIDKFVEEYEDEDEDEDDDEDDE